MSLRSMLPVGSRAFAARPGDADPFTTMRREMERMFDDLSSTGWAVPATASTSVLSPSVNVVETDKGLEISAEMPGIDQKDIDVELADGILTLKAERHAERDEKNEKQHYHIIERSYGTLLRRFQLPFDANPAKVEAQLDKGVLHVFVPREQPAEKPKTKIAIKTNPKA